MEEKYNKFFFDLIHGIHPYEEEDPSSDEVVTKVTVIPEDLFTTCTINCSTSTCITKTSMDCRISVSIMASVLQLVRCNFNHAMCQSHKIDQQVIALIEPIIANARTTMWMATSCHAINFKCVSTQDAHNRLQTVSTTSKNPQQRATSGRSRQ
jgi:hypothetical protein